MNTNICTRSLFFAPKLWEPHEGLMHRIVGAKLERVEPFGQHPAVVRLGRTANHGLHLVAIARSRRFPFLHKIPQRRLIHNREDDLFDHALRGGQRSFR